ncbi:hepatocellular carcinoma-associated antigen 59-domain-containing protein [Parasitella parasitica]|nr:hepatocellular carcinoma-associated antigen 59-domain-containing protein [Parasitella parasitica]
MAAYKKQKNYRKKKVDSDDDDETENSNEPTQDLQQVSATIEELTELRRLRRKPVGLDADKLLKGAEKKKKKKKIEDPNAWSLKKGGLVEPDAYRQKLDDDDAPSKSRKLNLDSFATATNTLDVDKHMMEYIESEMKKRRGGAADEDEDDNKAVDRGLVDIYEELYRIPDRLKGELKHQQPEGNVQLSTQMLTAIPEVDLGIDTRLQNIEETERAKRKLIDDTEREESKSNGQNALDHVPANFEKQIPKQYKPRLDHKLMATDDQAVARFKKRMRK